MKKLIILCLVLLLRSCSSKKENKIILEHSNSNHYEYNVSNYDFNNLYLKVYKLVHNKWKAIKSKKYSSNISKINIDFHDSNSNQYTICYYTEDKNQKIIDKEYDVNFTINNTDKNILHEKHNTEITLDKTHEYPLVLYEWNNDNETIHTDFSQIDINSEFNTNDAYIITISIK